LHVSRIEVLGHKTLRAKFRPVFFDSKRLFQALKTNILFFHNSWRRQSLMMLMLMMWGWPALCQSPDISAVIGRIQQHYAAVQTIRAEFIQHYQAPGIDQTESGTMYMKKPGLMRWEYRTPEAKLFVADGRETYLYTPEDHQVMIQRFTADDLRSTPLQLLLGKEDIRAGYDVAWETAPEAAGDFSVRLTPKSRDSEYLSLAMVCDRTTYDLHRLVIRERAGNTSQFEFRQVQINLKLDNSQFEFKIPKGVEVVRLDQKEP
jgi:outer membrane lipoprotein carrier protein